MVLAINDTTLEGGPRDRLSRVLGVAAALYSLLIVLTGAVAVVGVLGLFGQAADPGAIAPARMLALPWGLAAGPAEAADISALLVVAGGMAVNLLVLIVGSRLARGRLRG